jgi:hypothetical protein
VLLKELSTRKCLYYGGVGWQVTWGLYIGYQPRAWAGVEGDVVWYEEIVVEGGWRRVESAMQEARRAMLPKL